MINTIASTPSIIWPLFVLLLSISWVVLGITKLKLHPFLTLMIAAVIVGLLSGPLPDPSAENKGLFHDRVIYRVLKKLIMLLHLHGLFLVSGIRREGLA